VHPDGHRLGALIRSLLSDTHDFVARSACEAAARHRVTEAHDAVVRLLDATPEASRIAALHSLRTLWLDEDFERVLQAYSTSPSATVRKEAAWTLRSTGSMSTWPRLFALWCEDALPRHRRWACELAGRYGSRDVLTALKRLSDDVDGHVRVTAARAIVEVEARENP
jgi:HEAT repeat protein